MRDDCLSAVVWSKWSSEDKVYANTLSLDMFPSYVEVTDETF